MSETGKCEVCGRATNGACCAWGETIAESIATSRADEDSRLADVAHPIFDAR